MNTKYFLKAIIISTITVLLFKFLLENLNQYNSLSFMFGILSTSIYQMLMKIKMGGNSNVQD